MRRNFKNLLRTALAVIVVISAHITYAGPGAHGPDGEHLDSPDAAHVAVDAAPTLEAQSELFELVAALNEEELSVLIDRFQTNEPVLQAKVEVEVGDIRASATFHPDHGDYAFTDPKLLAKLREPGEHAVVFTVQAGNEVDLLAGTLVSAAHEHEHEHDETPVNWIAASLAGLVLFALLSGLIFRRRRQMGAAA